MIKAKDVKKVLRENNIDTKNISVRSKIVGYDSSINVTLKDLSLPKHRIQKILDKEFSSISYDERCGEILGGGNTFVFVDYDYNLLENAIEEKIPLATEFVEELNSKDDYWGYRLAQNNNLTLFASKEIESLYVINEDNKRLAQWLFPNDKNSLSGNIYSVARALVILENGNY